MSNTNDGRIKPLKNIFEYFNTIKEGKNKGFKLASNYSLNNTFIMSNTNNDKLNYWKEIKKTIGLQPQDMNGVLKNWLDSIDIKVENPYIEVAETTNHRLWNEDYDKQAICICGQKYLKHFKDNGKAKPCSDGGCNNFTLKKERTITEINEDITQVSIKHNLLTQELNTLKKELDAKYHKFSIPFHNYISSNYLNFVAYDIEVLPRKSKILFKVLKYKMTYEDFIKIIKKYTNYE